MIIGGRNIGEYNELNALSVEDFLIRFKLYVDSIELKQRQSKK